MARAERPIPYDRHRPSQNFPAPNRPFKYQGIVKVRFKASGDIQTVYTHSMLSSTRPTLAKLKEQIRKLVKQMMGTSPIEILDINFNAWMLV